MEGCLNEGGVRGVFSTTLNVCRRVETSGYPVVIQSAPLACWNNAFLHCFVLPTVHDGIECDRERGLKLFPVAGDREGVSGWDVSRTA